MAATSQQVTALRKVLSQKLLDQLTDALLQCSSVDHLKTPILRLDAFIQDGYDGGPGIANAELPKQQIISVSHTNTAVNLQTKMRIFETF
jgi:hypothetical protein